MEDKKSYFSSLNGLRAIAAFCIFISHLNFLNKTIFGGIYTLLSYARISVDCFFVLSAFLLCHKYQDTFMHGVTLKNWKKFIQKRLHKIYPVYLVTLIICMPWFIYNQKLKGWSIEEIARAFFVRLIQAIPLLQTLIPYDNWANAFNGVAWFLSCLFILYMISPFLLYWNSTIKELPLRILTTAFFGNIFVFSVVYTIFHALQFIIFPNSGSSLVYASPYIRVFPFIAGIILYDIYKRLLHYDIPVRLLETIELFSAIFAIGWMTTRNIMHFPTVIEEVVNIAVCCLLILIFSFDTGSISNFLKTKLLRKFASCSFEFYLIHYPVINIGYYFLNRWFGTDNMLSLFYVICFAALSIVLSYIAYMVQKRLSLKMC